MTYILLNYAGRIAPGIAATLGLLWVLRRKTAPELRLVGYILIFAVLRDAMGPAGLWQIASFPVVWARFNRNPLLLLGMGAGTLALSYGVWRFESKLSRGLVWRKKSLARALGLGLLGGLLIGAPAVITGFFVPAWVRGGVLSWSLYAPVLGMALAGNFLEELLFRGYLQGWFEKELGPGRAVWASALSFAAAHSFLAAQLGGIGGFTIIAFTLFEGLICASLRRREGLIAAALAHGLGIFLSVSGIPG